MNNLSGAGSETTNVAGVVLIDDIPASGAFVQLLPDKYDPVKDSALPSKHSVMTDKNGEYVFKQINQGRFSILAQCNKQKNLALITEINVSGGKKINAPDALLKPAGLIIIKTIPEIEDRENGYIYIPGTPLFVKLDSISDELVFHSVPQGKIPAIAYSSLTDTVSRVIRNDINVESHDTVFVFNPEWPYSRNIFLNTSPSGAAVEGDVHNFPVLIRLSRDIFDFSLAAGDGSDLHFNKADNSSIPFQIERWDSVTGVGEVWVKLDTVYGNNKSQYITMYWGNRDSTIESGNVVFDTSSGFQGVWHLGEDKNTIFHDATENQYHGTSFGIYGPLSAPGVIGMAQNFDGESSYIAMPNTADGKLDFPENGSYSVSLWAYADTIDTLWHGVVSKGNQQYYIQYKCFNPDSISWEFVEFKGLTGWQYSEQPVIPAIGHRKWIYITGIRDGGRQYLYLNGERVRNTAFLNSDNAATLERNTTGDFVIGCHLRPNMLPEMVGWSFFNGKIDEVRVMNRVTDANWVKLCYMNQKEVNSLVEFR